MLMLIFKCAWFLLPAALSNTFASLGSKLPVPGFLGKPINEGLFGSHKTFRGFVVGPLTGILAAWIQSWLYLNFPFFAQNTMINYSKASFLIVGFLLGFGALTGDLIKSFFKRRFGKRPGEDWFPWDELDWAIGALIFISLIYLPNLEELIKTLIIYFLVHVASDRVAYFTGIKKTPN